MYWFIIMAFTISSSIDNLGVGISYGIRKLNIQFEKNLLIAVVCFLFSMAGITFGVWLASILPGMVPLIVGSFLLVIIGIRIMLLAKPVKKEQEEGHIEVSGMNKSVRAKFDGQISWGESVVLGIALSANALTNGVGAGLLGLSPLIISVLASIGSFVTVWAGVKFGVKLADVRFGSYTIGQFGTFLSGVIILIVAIMVFF